MELWIGFESSSGSLHILCLSVPISESGLTATEMKDLAAGLQRKRKKLLSNLKEGLELVPRDLNVGKNDSKDEESHLYDFIQGLFSGRDVT